MTTTHKQAATQLPAGTEYILSAAIFVETGLSVPVRRSYTYPETGIMFCSWRHGDCFVALNAWADLLPKEERERIGEANIAGRVQGFLTSKGRFVDRREAAHIAWMSRQIPNQKSELFSEDLY